ncbi:hypothetical protein NMY22_g16016 [Coprinellus aureogranulatus]|nr:hypothetical protein NMY22_g16016 [Coprinellus aureogranulatus]
MSLWVRTRSGRLTAPLGYPFRLPSRAFQHYLIGAGYSFDAQASDHFHVVPSELRWKPRGGAADVRVYGDLYHSDEFLKAYREIQGLAPAQKDDDLPRYVVALMFASDETKLASFGNATVWPLYLLFGNESKYRRSKASLNLFEEMAYLQSIPDAFSDWYTQRSGKNSIPQPVKAHLNREVFHAQWRILLDDDFVNAYKHGLVVSGIDGVKRRFYPRIFTYTSDYPERTTIVSIRNLGDCPCPRCLVSADDIPMLGTPEDVALRESTRRVDDQARRKLVEKAQQLVHKKNLSVNTPKIEALLKGTSLVPSSNAFSDSLSPLGFDMYRMMAVDILHEFEIGVWKDLFIHLLRMIEATDPANTAALNRRFRQVPTFGTDTIRRFSNNMSEMRQLGARDYEDLLQCALPVFEGLFPDGHDGHVQDLLFTMAHWHSLAKMRMHTDQSLHVLQLWTTVLGEEARSFIAETCAAVKTLELKREYERRKRAQAKKKGQPKIDLSQRKKHRLRSQFRLLTYVSMFCIIHPHFLSMFRTTLASEAHGLRRESQERAYHGVPAPARKVGLYVRSWTRREKTVL